MPKNETKATPKSKQYKLKIRQNKTHTSSTKRPSAEERTFITICPHSTKDRHATLYPSNAHTKNVLDVAILHASHFQNKKFTQANLDSIESISATASIANDGAINYMMKWCSRCNAWTIPLGAVRCTNEHTIEITALRGAELGLELIHRENRIEELTAVKCNLQNENIKLMDLLIDLKHDIKKLDKINCR